MADFQHVAVIGGGISGLACAYRLQQLGLSFTLLEASEKVGGLIGTVRTDGFLFETGPQSFQGTDLLLSLIREVGLEGDLCKADPAAPRYVLRHGRLQKVPMSPQALVASSLVSPGARWKVVSEPFRRSKPPSEDESVAEFVRRKFGHEILEYLVAPFVSGVYAGDPEKLSLRAAFPSLEEWEREYGSVLRGAMKSRSPQKKGPPPLCSFGNGMRAFAEAIAVKLGERVQTGAHVADVSLATDQRAGASGGNSHRISVTRKHNDDTIDAAAVVFATPAYTVGHMVASMSASLAETLSGIAYAPVAVVAAGYYAKQILQAPEGFGFLVPRSEKCRTLGTVWNSSLFPERAREGTFAITSFVGGATDPEIVEKSDDEIMAIVQADNARIMGITGSPIHSAVWKHRKALPQYNLGHGHIVEAIRDAETKHPGLFFSGNYLEGPALGKCVDHGFKTAEAVRNYLGARV